MIVHFADSIVGMENGAEDYSVLIKQVRRKLRKALRAKDTYLPIPEDKKKLVDRVSYPLLFAIKKKIQKKQSNLKELLHL